MKSRPAETTGVAGAVALLVARLLGVDDPDVIVSLAVLIGFLPAAVTWVVANVIRDPKPRVDGEIPPYYEPENPDAR